MMDNIKITDMGNGFYKLKPYPNYLLLNKQNKKTYKIAVTDKVFNFEAINK